MAKAICEHASLNLAQAKRCTDRVLEGEAVSIAVSNSETAQRLADVLQWIGTTATENAES
ncbi:MAG: hypothetical protein KDA58_14155 [Planctomycetaceae bacterium]|nr:hypothetical protein [Planctomycetaceae bacterium]